MVTSDGLLADFPVGCSWEGVKIVSTTVVTDVSVVVRWFAIFAMSVRCMSGFVCVCVFVCGACLLIV